MYLLIILVSVAAIVGIKVLSVIAFETSNNVLSEAEINDRLFKYGMFTCVISLFYWMIVFWINRNWKITTILSLCIFWFSFLLFYQQKAHYLAEHRIYFLIHQER